MSFIKKNSSFCFVTSLIFFTQFLNSSSEIPLLNAYPSLKESIHHASLGTLPTPIKKLEQLGVHLNVKNLFIKQDNLSGKLFGGNKIRKLEFLLGDAQAHNAQGVVTIGFAGSNHTCATAIYAHQLSMKCLCLHLPQIPTAYLRRNLLLSQAHGAQLYLYRTPGEREKALHEHNKLFKKEIGQCLYFIPSGGSNELGCLGFVNAAFELKEQINQNIIPEPDFIYVALGSGSTVAGLMLGIKLIGLKSVVVPICIEPATDNNEHAKKIINLYNLTSQYINKRDPSIPLFELAEKDVTINYNFNDDKYAQISQRTADVIQLMAKIEHIKLDGSYTGKACTAMLDDIKNKKLHDNVILFWNTYSDGEKTINDNYTPLPQAYHSLYTAELQKYDQGV